MSDAKTAAFLQSVATSMDTYAARKLQSAEIPDSERPPVLRPWDSAGVFLPRVLDLAALTNNVELGIAGYEVSYVAPASTQGGVLILNDSIALYPGQRVRAYFEALRVRRGNSGDGALLVSATTGTAYLVVHKVPDLQYREDFYVAGSVQAITSATEIQATTQPAPTGATEGIALSGASSGWRVTVAADATKTLSGTGQLDIYYREPTLALWGIDPDLVIPVPASVSGLRVWTAPDIPCLVPTGRGAAIANGVGVSAGGLTLYYSAY